MRNLHGIDASIEDFKAELREDEIIAIHIQKRFTLRKSYVRRVSGDATYSTSLRDMMFEATPTFKKESKNINKELATAYRGIEFKVTAQNIKSGLVDFKELVAQTRAKMHASFSKGQALGNSRTKKALSSRKGKQWYEVPSPPSAGFFHVTKEVVQR